MPKWALFLSNVISCETENVPIYWEHGPSFTNSLSVKQFHTLYLTVIVLALWVFWILVKVIHVDSYFWTVLDHTWTSKKMGVVSLWEIMWCGFWETLALPMSLVQGKGWSVYSKYATVTVNSMVIQWCLKLLQRKPLKDGKHRVCVFFHPLERHFLYTDTVRAPQCARLNTIKRCSISSTQPLQMTSSCVMCQREPLKSGSYSCLSSPENFKYNVFSLP